MDLLCNFCLLLWFGVPGIILVYHVVRLLGVGRAVLSYVILSFNLISKLLFLTLLNEVYIPERGIDGRV